MGSSALEVEAVRVVRGERELGPWSTTVRAGEVQQWCGPNGSGKSTLLEIVAGLVVPAAGRVRIGGSEVLAGTDPFERDVTIVLQEFGLWPRRRIGQQIALVQAHAKRDLPWDFGDIKEALGLEEFATRRPESLSVGEQQRCAIARALAKPASVVLLDEPLSAQDDASRSRVEEVIETLRASGAAVVIASHLSVDGATSRFEVNSPKGA